MLSCVNHPERDAVSTVGVREIPLGKRPMILNMIVDAGGKYYDLCAECLTNFKAVLPNEEEV